ncbi:hypothetical protein AB0D67_38445 [Streptosporangium sp. NPDC048047]|uniref:hypothetical protein n=1 Tax=Streptosporangium sp. NPDC048047 TaxID=3155748 RepID=UPI003448EE83
MEVLAAERNAAVADTFPLKSSGRIVWELATELPLDVLELLTHVPVDLGLIVRTALHATRAQDPNAATMGVIDMVVDQLTFNKELPDQVMTAVQQMAVRLLGEQGFADFFALRPAALDIIALAKGADVGVRARLEESSPSSGSVSGGTTSTPISPTTIPGSTPAEPSSGRVTRVRRPLARVERLPADALIHTTAEQRWPKPQEVRRPGLVIGTIDKAGIARAIDVMMALASLRPRTSSATTPPATGTDIIAHPTAPTTKPVNVPGQAGRSRSCSAASLVRRSIRVSLIRARNSP